MTMKYFLCADKVTGDKTWVQKETTKAASTHPVHTTGKCILMTDVDFSWANMIVLLALIRHTKFLFLVTLPQKSRVGKSGIFFSLLAFSDIK